MSSFISFSIDFNCISSRFVFVLVSNLVAKAWLGC